MKQRFLGAFFKGRRFPNIPEPSVTRPLCLSGQWVTGLARGLQQDRDGAVVGCIILDYMAFDTGQAAHKTAVQPDGQHVGHAVRRRAWPHVMEMADQGGTDLIEIPRMAA